MTKPQINVTPLIDVLLVLLIIFMVVTPLKPSSFEAKIPREPAKDQKVDPHPHTNVVAIDANSRLSLNNAKLGAGIETPERLVERLREIFSSREQNLVFERTVFIKAPRGLDYGSVAKAVDAVKMAGAAPISLQIDGLD